MRIYYIIMCAIIGLLLTNCQGDAADGKVPITNADKVADKAEYNPRTEATQVTTDNTKSSPSRSTENMKVNMSNAATPTQATTTIKPAEVKSGQDPNRLSANNQARKQQKAKEERSKKAYKGKGLPSACDLVNASFISKVMGDVEFSDIVVKDGSGKKAVDARSCFFKWDDKGNPNGGVLLQVQRNPLPDEFPDWASYYISSKRNQGDQMPDGSGSYRYKDFPGMGLAGGYNYDLARYVWRTKTGNVFMVAFNLQTSSEAEQLIWAEKIGKEAQKNFERYIK